MEILQLMGDLLGAVRARTSGEGGAVGWLTLGIVIGVLLVVGGIIKFLIPGE